MNNRENGSWLGVMTAAKTAMPTAAHRRPWRSCAVLTTPTSSRNTSSTGNSNATPNADEHQHDERQVLVGVMSGWISPPPIAEQEVERLLDREPGDDAAERRTARPTDDDERDRVAPLVLVQAGHDEAPDLPDDDRHASAMPAVAGDLEPHEERRERIGDDEVAAVRPQPSRLLRSRPRTGSDEEVQDLRCRR